MSDQIDPNASAQNPGTGEGQQNQAQPTQQPTEATPTVEELLAERDKWKALSRKNEEAKNAALGELDQLKTASMTDAERAMEEAKQTVRKATLAEVGTRLAKAELTSQAAKAQVQIPEGLDSYLKYESLLNADGEPDAEAIKALVSTFQPSNQFASPQALGIGHQSGGSTAVDYSPEAIAKRVFQSGPFGF